MRRPGPVQNISTTEQAYAALRGQWRICSGLNLWQGDGAPTDTIGVEFGPASSSDGRGGGANGPIQLNIHPIPNSGFGAAIRYSPCPTELDVDLYGHSILVSF